MSATAVKLRFTERATRDLQRLRAFIAKDNLTAARHKIYSLLRSIRYVVNQPHLGREIDQASGMRQWVAGDYAVRCFVDEPFLTINRIWHGKEDRAISDRR